MDKLGYTFYPKDWWTSSTFFKLPPELRYLYLEIISMMYLDDGKWEANRYDLHKRFGVDPGEKGWELLQSLFVVTGKYWTHESVNKRLRKAIANRENGQKGGRPKTQKTQLENPKKPTLEKERETEREDETITEWMEWGKDIVDDKDFMWHNMRGRRISEAEMNAFLSVATRNKWKMETQHSFRVSLRGFDWSKSNGVKERPNPGKTQ